MLAEEIVRFWGADNLKRWPETALRDVRIPQTGKRFLAEVGLPARVDWTLRFDPEADSLPPLPNRRNYRRIGFDDIIPICLDENRDGCVVVVETEIGGGERFVNSTVERLAGFLVLYQH